MAIMNPYNYSKPTGVKSIQVGDKKPENTSGGDITKTKTDAYLEQKILNARPEELTLMLYEGLIKFMKQVEIFNEQKNIDKSNNANMRAQAILEELRSTLNMEVEVSVNLENLYIYLVERMVDINISKSNEGIQEVIALATDLRDAWKSAMCL